MRLTVVLLFLTQLCFGQSELTEGVKNFKFFSIGYGEKGTNWCSYRLTHEMVKGDSSLKRERFREFNGISTGDYTNTGYDRGHLAAADTFSFDQEAYSQTYSLGNIVPMAPGLNRQVWKWLEVYEKNLALEKKCINVTIRVVYGDEKVKSLWIPKKFIRIISNCNLEPLGRYEFLNIE